MWHFLVSWQSSSLTSWRRWRSVTCHLWVFGLAGWLVAPREEKIWKVLFPKYLPEAHQNDWLVLRVSSMLSPVQATGIEQTWPQV